MNIHKGGYRVALVFNRLTIKLPIIRIRKGLKHLIKEMKRGWLKKIYSDSILYLGTSKSFLFGGIIQNYQEGYFYKTHKLQITTPTYFSFFGLINIQKTVKALNMKATDVWCQLVPMTEEMVWDDSHTFSNPENFGTDQGKIVIVDYPLKTQSVLIKYGDKIQNEFDFSYDWEKEKQKLK